MKTDMAAYGEWGIRTQRSENSQKKDTVSIDCQIQTIGATEIHNLKKGEAGQNV
jgi:hypothetical protein